ncbi:hypothetical protein ACEPAG_722 [Sanghuangporus baumii]
MEVQIFVNWAGAPLTETLVLRAIDTLSTGWHLITADSASDHHCSEKPLLQWATYDSINHETTLSKPSSALASSYIIRKALIRKHFLHRCILAYTTKHPDSSLSQYVPRTWDIEISYADELDELWSDELWDLDKKMKRNADKWWILKPGMADRGMGIRLFKSKKALQQIFEDFENEEKDEEAGKDSVNGGAGVIISQLRHFVIQEYLENPVLVDPNQTILNKNAEVRLQGRLERRKFHLRVYCVASGALTVYLYPRVLALFAPEEYKKPSQISDSVERSDLRSHLTNTCLQGAVGEENVRLLHELIGCNILSGDGSDASYLFSEEDVASIMDQISDALSETFKAALQMPVHFQPLPNAFELFGVDFLVSHGPCSRTGGRFLVKLLEFNSEPAIEMTGTRLKWILEDLFELISRTCVEPFFNREIFGEVRIPCRTGLESSCAFRKCLVVNLRN